MGARGAGGCRRCGRDERGQAVVLFALLLPVLFALGAIVMDVGNWYVHKRHLQTQVDAAALAGATKFVGCSFQFGNPLAANQAIKATALKYTGDMNRDPATSNLQLQEPIKVHAVLNGARYWDEGDPVDDPTLAATLDNTFDPDGDPGTPGTPCETKTLDVKATEHDAPLLWGLLPATPSPKTKAKVEIRQIREQMRMLPFAVPEIDPAAVVALFVDEDAAGGEVVDWQHLGQLDDPDLPYSEWQTFAGQEDVSIGSDNIGVIILVSKEDTSPSLTGTLLEICGQAPNLVACYGAADRNSAGAVGRQRGGRRDHHRSPDGERGVVRVGVRGRRGAAVAHGKVAGNGDLLHCMAHLSIGNHEA